MPFSASTGGVYGAGRSKKVSSALPSPYSLPAYYTTNSGYLMYKQGFNSSLCNLKTLAEFSTNTNIRTYNVSITPFTVVHDKDLDSNVYYAMPTSSPRFLYKFLFTKGGTTVTNTETISYTGATSSPLGACYAPSCLWSGTNYGAFVIGGSLQKVVLVFELNATKTNISYSYTVPYISDVYGVEMIPVKASGFQYHYGVVISRTSKQLSSWMVTMDTRSWRNRQDTSYTSGVNGPSSPAGLMYYPIGKQIIPNDPDTSTNRIAILDVGTTSIYVWTVTESGNTLVWTFLKIITGMPNNGGYPYHLSTAAYNAIA